MALTLSAPRRRKPLDTANDDTWFPAAIVVQYAKCSETRCSQGRKMEEFEKKGKKGGVCDFLIMSWSRNAIVRKYMFVLFYTRRRGNRAVISVCVCVCVFSCAREQRGNQGERKTEKEKAHTARIRLKTSTKVINQSGLFPSPRRSYHWTKQFFESEVR